MEMREVLAPAPSADESIEMGQRAGARVAGDAAELQDRLLTHTWDGTARGGAASRPAPAEGDVQHVQPPCSVRVITALDRGIGQYVVKEGVSWLKLARALQQQAIASHPPVLRVQTRVRHVDSCVMGQRIRLGASALHCHRTRSSAISPSEASLRTETVRQNLPRLHLSGPSR